MKIFVRLFTVYFLCVFCFSQFVLASDAGGLSITAGDIGDFRRITVSPRDNPSKFLMPPDTTFSSARIDSFSNQAHFTGQVVAEGYGLVRFLRGWYPSNNIDPQFASGDVLSVDSDSKVCAHKISDDFAGQWNMFRTADGYFVIENRSTNPPQRSLYEKVWARFFGASGRPKSCLTYNLETNRVFISEYTGANNQQWKINIIGDDVLSTDVSYTIHSDVVPSAQRARLPLSNKSHVFLSAKGDPACCLRFNGTSICAGRKDLFSWFTVFENFGERYVVFQIGRRPFMDGEIHPWFCSGSALGHDDGGSVIPCPIDGTERTVRWCLVHGDDDFYRVQNLNSGLYLTYDSVNNKVIVYERTDSPTLYQTWRLGGWADRDLPYQKR